MKAISYFLALVLVTGTTLAQTITLSRHPDGSVNVNVWRGDKLVRTVPNSIPGSIGTEPAESSPLVKESGVPPFDWTLQFSQPGKVFKAVSFADPLHGFIVTELGGVYKTVNGGISWTSVMNLGFPYYWYGVDALTPDTVAIAGFNNQGQITDGVVRWSFDGGLTWQPEMVLTIPFTGVGWLDQVHFFNADTGIVFNSMSGGCWYTSTGGKDVSSWSYITINPDRAWLAGNIDAQSDGTVFGTGVHFASSSDFGQTWTSGPSADYVFDGGVDFVDTDHLLGWTGGGQISTPVSGWIHRTTDGAGTWSDRLQNFPYPVRAVQFFTGSTGIALAGNLYDEAGGIYSSADSGLTWNEDVNTAAEMFAFDYQVISADSMDIWCVGSTGGSTGYTGKLYKTRTGNLVTGFHSGQSPDQNQSWLEQNIPNPVTTYAVINYNLPDACHVTLMLFDVFGNELRTLEDNLQGPGEKSLVFHADGLSNGIYFYQLRAGNHLETKKLVVQK